MQTLSYQHRGGTTPLIGVPIYTFLKDIAQRFPEEEAVVSVPQGTRLSYSAFFNRVERLSRALMAQDIRRGDRVGIWATNNMEWVVLQIATSAIGAILVNINPAYRVGEVEHALKAARIQTLFLMPAFRKSNYVEMVRQLVPELNEMGPDTWKSESLNELRRVIVYDPVNPMETERPAPGFMTWQEVLAKADDVSADALLARSISLDMDDPINIQFTSGTTGFAKPVVLTHHNLINNAQAVAEEMHFTEADRLCVPVPFYHCFGMVLSNLACLSHGATIVIPCPHFEAGAILEAVQKEKCTALHGVPTMFVAELEHPNFKDYDLTSLRTGIMAGAPCPAPLMTRVIEEMHCGEILIAYGQTEASPVTHITRVGDSFERRIGSVGTNLPHQEVKVVDPETGQVLPRGTQGEICFRGYHVMKGYFEMPEATASTIDEAGWLHSGDLGDMDGDGYVRITGRLKDMIIRGGENIYPAEIEAHLLGHEAIAQVAVFGIPHERWGEEVACWVQLHENSEAGLEDILGYAKERLAHFKVPTHMEIVDEFPMTVTGKIQKFRMRDVVVEAKKQVLA